MDVSFRAVHEDDEVVRVAGDGRAHVGARSARGGETGHAGVGQADLALSRVVVPQADMDRDQ